MQASPAHLRPYQAEAIAAIDRDWNAGITDALLVAATGAGKTHMFLSLLISKIEGTSKRALIIAHRQELIDQPIERLCEFWPDWADRVGAVMAERDDCDRQIIVATVQTLAQPKRLARILAHGPIDYFITDEAHHATATSYMQLLTYLRLSNPNLRHLGVTATPIRGDGDALAQVFQKVSAKYGIRELVPTWLVPPRWLAIATGISLRGVASRNGDYVPGQLADAFEVDNCFDLVVTSHQQYADGRKAIAFTPSVAGAHALAEKFNDAGIPAAAVDGTTPKDERRRILDAFRAGQYEVLANCAVLTEGYDCPDISCIHQVRPTKSDALYTQMIGRGLRPVPGKDDCLILDYAPAETRNIAMLGDLLGIPKDRQVYDGDVEGGTILGGFTFDGEIRGIEGDPRNIVARQLRYLEDSPLAWIERDGWMVLGLGPDDDEVDRQLALSPFVPDMPQWLYLVSYPPKSQPITTVLDGGRDFNRLSERANSYAEQHANTVISQKDQRWRDQPASDPQINYLRRLLDWSQSKEALPDMQRLSKGKAGRLIAFYKAKTALLKAQQWRGPQIKKTQRADFDDEALALALMQTRQDDRLSALVTGALASVEVRA